jgi:hypothetical protein
MPAMDFCKDTGLSIPECACPRCLERQLDRFAPATIRVRRTIPHDPVRLAEVRAPQTISPVSGRLNRPAL